MAQKILNVLVVSSGNAGYLSPFVIEQARAIAEKGVKVDYFHIEGVGIWGYLKNLKPLQRKIQSLDPDLIHAHYGLSGLLANLQRKVPVITTYHGSDINESIPFLFSKLSIWLSGYNIFVSSKLATKARVHNNYAIRSCGIDMNNFKVKDRSQARENLGLDLTKKYVLFSSAFSNEVKNYPLAMKAIAVLQKRGVRSELLELKGYNRAQVNDLMNAVNCVLVTSFKESGPLVIKEAMAVNTCAVSVDVGDVKEVISGLEGYYLTSYDPEDVAEKLQIAIHNNERTQGRMAVEHLDNTNVAGEIISIYNSLTETLKA